jgi:RNA polymerase sigma-70 factor (ECF subfamily)
VIFKRKNITGLKDEQLMAAIINGDQAAFSELYSRFNKRLYYFFIRMLGNDNEIANDFLQDIFLKIIYKPELYNPEYKFSNWVFSIAHNMCKNEYRKRQNRGIVHGNETLEMLGDANETEVIDKENLIARMFSELEKLEDNQKSVLLLKYKENFSLKEIADILELPVGTIKSRLHYARQELSKRMAGSEIY